MQFSNLQTNVVACRPSQSLALNFMNCKQVYRCCWHTQTPPERFSMHQMRDPGNRMDVVLMVLRIVNERLPVDVGRISHVTNCL